jgi:predicted ester cyclase
VSTEENKKLIGHVVAQINQGNWAVFDDHPGLAEVKASMMAGQAAMPNAQTMLEIVIAEGDWVAARLLESGTLASEHMGRAAGEKLTFEAIVMFQVLDGRIMKQYSQGGVI